jgi:hypothetical protein
MKRRAPKPEINRAILRLLRSMGRAWPAARERAKWQLSEHNKNEVISCMETLVEEGPEPKAPRWLWATAIVFITVVIRMWVLPAAHILPRYWYIRSNPWWYEWLYWLIQDSPVQNVWIAFVAALFGISFTLLAVGIQITEFRHDRLQRGLLRAALLSEDIRCADILIGLISRDSKRERGKSKRDIFSRRDLRRATEHIVPLLHRLPAENLIQKIAGHQSWLYQPIIARRRPAKNASRIIELLELIRRSEDVEMIRFVRILARGALGSEETTRVVEAARECLSVLEARLAKDALAGTLLRPADISGNDPNRLVRPIEAANEANPEMLLRIAAASSVMDGRENLELRPSVENTN